LKLSVASHGESSILKVNYNSIFARLPRSKRRCLRSLPNSRSLTTHTKPNNSAILCSEFCLVLPQVKQRAILIAYYFSNYNQYLIDIQERQLYSLHRNEQNLIKKYQISNKI